MQIAAVPPVSRDDIFVPVGAFYFPVNSVRKTRHFSFLLLRGFTLLAFSSAIEPLRIANQLSQRPLYSWDVHSEDGRPVRSSSGVEVSVDSSLDDLADKAQLMVCSGNLEATAASERTLARLRRHHRHGGKLGGLCTGAFVLARAGVLQDRVFTLHWENQPGFIETFPDLSPSSRRYETDGALLTCGGGAAASDLMLWVISRDYGEDFAIMVSEMCLRACGPGKCAEDQRSSLATVVSTRNSRILRVMHEMHRNIESPRPIKDLAQECGLSRRQIERQFRTLLNETPMKTYRNIRLDHARQLFTDSDLNVAEVASACGFSSLTHFSRCYRDRFGTSPSAYRFRKQITSQEVV